MKKILLFLLCFLPLFSPAAEEEDEKHYNQISLAGALDSNDAWEVEFSYMRRFNSWLGAGVGLNFYAQYVDNIDVHGAPIPDVGASSWILSDRSKRAAGLQLNPYVHFNTPSLIRIESAGIKLFAEPGLLTTAIAKRKVEKLMPGDSGYTLMQTYTGHGGDWLFWSVRLGATLENDDGAVSIGWLGSNMDMYSFVRHIRIDDILIGDHLPARHLHWGVFISLAYKF